MMDMYKKIHTLAKRITRRPIKIQKADKQHYPAQWHVYFSCSKDALEFAYQAQVNRLQICTNVHGDIWIWE